MKKFVTLPELTKLTDTNETKVRRRFKTYVREGKLKEGEDWRREFDQGVSQFHYVIDEERFFAVAGTDHIYRNAGEEGNKQQPRNVTDNRAANDVPPSANKDDNRGDRQEISHAEQMVSQPMIAELNAEIEALTEKNEKLQKELFDSRILEEGKSKMLDMLKKEREEDRAKTDLYITQLIEASKEVGSLTTRLELSAPKEEPKMEEREEAERKAESDEDRLLKQKYQEPIPETPRRVHVQSTDEVKSPPDYSTPREQTHSDRTTW